MTLAAAAIGATAGVGTLLIILGVRGTAPRPATPSARRTWKPQGGLLHAAVGLGAALTVLAVTGWVVGALLAAGAALALPKVVGGAARRQLVVDRTEAIARWAEMLRDTMAGALGLEEAIAVTAPVAPRAIALEVGRLAVRLERWSLTDALRQLGEDLADPAGDLLVAALTTAATKETREVGRLLGALAASTRDVARMHERVETSRAGIRSAVRMIVITVLGFIAGLVLLARAYLQPYDTLAGQLWLLLVGGVFAAAFLLLRRIAAIRMPPRSFALDPQGSSWPR